MSTVDKKWFLRQMAAVDISGRKLSERMGWDPNTVSVVLAGRRRVSSSEAADLARHLRVPLEDLLKHLGVNVPRESRAQVPIVGVADATGTVGKRRGGIPRGAERPPGVADGVAAVLVQAPGKPEDGWVAYYIPGNDVDPAAVGRWCVARRGAGETRLGVLRQGYERGTWVVGGEEREGPLEWAAPVVWIRA